MRILHTSDWHMGDTLGHVDRSEDILRSLRQIARYLDDAKVDVMLATGDLFSDRLRQDKLRDAVSAIKKIFLPFLERGGTILAISGNHDNETFFETLRDALDLVSPAKKSSAGVNARGRLYLAPNPRNISLRDEKDFVTQFVLMPYPTARCHLQSEKANYRNLEEKHMAIKQRFVSTLQHLKSQLDLTQPSVLMSHIHVRGSKIHNLFRLTDTEDVIFETEEFEKEALFAYAAYGHIHKPQEPLKGAAHIRYAGSIERLDIAEEEDEKSVVLFEIGKGGLIGKPELLNLDSSPIYHVEIKKPETEIPRLAEIYKDRQPERALVKYTLHYQPDKHNLEAMYKDIEAVFPRWYRRDPVAYESDSGRAAFTPDRIQNVVGTVRDYLQTQFKEHPRKKELLALAETILAEGDWK